MDMKPRGGRSRNVFRVRGGIAVALSLTLFACFVSYNLLQGTGNIGKLFQSVIVDNEEENLSLNVDKYLVWSPKCQIPNIDPFHSSILKFLSRGDPIVCSKKPPLTYTTIVPEGTGQHMLRINTSAIPHYSSHPDNISCCYSVVTRINTPDGKAYNKSADNLYSVGKCITFHKDVILTPEEEFFIVRCNDFGTKGSKEVYVNIHAVVPIKQGVQSKLDKAQEMMKEQQRLNILILGFDSISRMNMLRSMPKTIKHLLSTGWLELFGYNKVDDNTMPNVSAFLMGLSLEQIKKRCWDSAATKFDNCPFLWNEFSKQGYVTAYIEDEPTGGTFNYHKTGFMKPPTDYYIRPILLAAENNLEVKQRDRLNVCLGPSVVTDIILSYVTNFSTVFNSALYFMMTWINNFSHSSISTPGTMDDKILQFFHDLEKTGALNTSLVIFLSDHGMRWGDFRETSIGWLEERLPFIYIWVPEWFKIKHPDRYKNLKLNSNRLTSPYDIHMTLKDILGMSGLSNISKTSEACPGCPKCVSLFSEVPADRACEEAGITDNWCTCTKYKGMPTKGKTVKAVAMLVLSEINAKLKRSRNATTMCAELTLDRVIKIKRKVQDNHHSASKDDYVVVFDTLPGGARFEATVGRSSSSSGSSSFFHLKGSVSRLNTYGNQSYCVDDPELKLYCYCKQLHTYLR